MLVTSALLFIRRTKGDMNFEPIPPKPYSMPLVIDLIAPSGQIYNRMIYTYNSKGLETSIKTGSEEGYERTNYKYEGKKSSYTDVFYDVNNNRYQTECITHFGDTKYTNRVVYTYNAQGLEIGRKNYSGDKLTHERKDYTYEDKKSSYIEVFNDRLSTMGFKTNITYLF